ncbi:bifunctional diaminohydroxyphosphoribosylaminopyrimidine deaminase/5-amino-6-(5-phosphoribosylamino)uracil reductase RibD [Inhella sp.]|uniref:bifunctional diaminohydroxyphosphoribosylaminopyrimidine deaminase/5-amino-6-(5-phosphoribosylamino)uracil reductase RibD n=1 Tax=Inhella sp. TaxID=1921806 RepID=UPI0035AED478
MASVSEADQRWMRRALRLAEQAIGLSEPNPRVGCVLVSSNGEVLGEGHTQAAGQAHAEVMALRDASLRGHPVRGATAFVTLEPCAHHGRTPPCCEALSAAGVARVVVATGDTNPRVKGAGVAHLRAQGIRVDEGLLEAQARALNIGFLHRMRTGRPWVRLKWASSLDARTALPDGQSQWITGPEARQDNMVWRRRAAVLLTGIGTVLADDPRLDVRDPPSPSPPARWVLDRWLRMPCRAQMLRTKGDVVIVHQGSADVERRRALQEAGARCLEAPSDLAALLDELGRREVNELHIEAGATLNGAWLGAHLVDELLVYLAPRLLGPGRGVADLPTLPSLDAAQGWRWLDTVPVGADLRLRLTRSF